MYKGIAMQLPSVRFIEKHSLANKRIFVRADLNVPLDQGTITSDVRLKALMPTLLYLQATSATIIIGTHLGSPTPDHCTPADSTQQLLAWFKQHGFDVRFHPDVTQPIAQYNKGSIHLLENLRCYKGEKKADILFAKQLASLADIYVNDAFGTLHRNDTSIALLPSLFASNNRYIGLLVEKEITELEQLKTTATQPFVMIFGGAKLVDKIPLITNFLQKPLSQRPSAILLGGALALAFLKAQGLSIGSTTIASETITQAKSIIQMAQQYNVTLVLPTDFAIIEGPLGSAPQYCSSTQIPANMQCVDIGPATITAFQHIITQARTIFINGTMGIFEYPGYQEGTKRIFQAAADCKGYSVLGGGDSSAAAEQLGLLTTFSFVSTGGGATLAYLGTNNPWSELPGLQAFMKK